MDIPSAHAKKMVNSRGGGTVVLLTVYFADYGSYFQATALYDQIVKLGYCVELVHESFRYAKSARLLAGSAMSRILPAGLNQLIGKKWAAYNTYLILKKDISRLKVSKPALCVEKRYTGCDCVVVGSDEQWSVTNPNARYISDVFGIGITCPHISYATSGITLEEDHVASDLRQKITDGLRSFTMLSARDAVTKEWVERWLGKPGCCLRVLDPTLLNPYFVEIRDAEPIVVVYGEHFSPEQSKAIVSFAAQKGYQLMAIAWHHKWCDSFLRVTEARDVPRAFGRAAYCAVSTFHGAIFSILSHKPFVSFMTEQRGAKVRDLLLELGMSDRIYDPDKTIPEEVIDYDAVEERLSDLRCISLGYLTEALAAACSD